MTTCRRLWLLLRAEWNWWRGQRFADGGEVDVAPPRPGMPTAWSEERIAEFQRYWDALLSSPARPHRRMPLPAALTFHDAPPLRTRQYEYGLYVETDLRGLRL